MSLEKEKQQVFLVMVVVFLALSRLLFFSACVFFQKKKFKIYLENEGFVFVLLSALLMFLHTCHILFCRFSGVPLVGRRNRIWHGDLVDLKDP
jgi:hypothetical protein